MLSKLYVVQWIIYQSHTLYMINDTGETENERPVTKQNLSNIAKDDQELTRIKI